MTTINLGNLKFTWKGNWQPSTLYNKDDVVKYGATVYVCTDSHTTGTVFATNASKFDLMVEGITFDGAYDPSTLYQVNDIVSYGGAIYVCIAETSGITPTNDTFWSKLVGGVEWENEYNNSSLYQNGDIVSYGGYVYIATQDTTGNNPTDTNYWDILLKGYNYRTTYQDATQYFPGDVVTYGGYQYIVKEGVITTQAPTTSNDWSILVRGVNDRGEYSNEQTYYTGDVVLYGGVKYQVKDGQISTPGFNPPSDFNTWQEYIKGFNYVGEWDNSIAYKKGDIVKYGGRQYLAIDFTIAGDAPTDPTKWVLYGNGMQWEGIWDIATAYKVNDVVEYAQSSYISVSEGNVSNQPDTDDGTNWQLVAQGDSNAVLAQRGDLLIRDANNITRLPLGPSGSFLYSDGNDVTWGHQSPLTEYYVSLEGSDSNDGRTPNTSWRTLEHACVETYSLGQVKINIAAGTYNELVPMKIGRSVVVEGNGLGAVTISPDNSNDKGYGVGISKDGSTPNANSDVFHLNNGSRLRNIVFRGFGTGSVCTALDPGYGPNDTSVWITSQSPYVQNCTSFTPEGTGMLIDGSLHNGGYKSAVANDWTQINSDGIGIHVKSDARVELVSVFTYYCNIGYLAESGGKIRALVGNNSYGEYGAVARGFSQAETPLTGRLQLSDDTINSVQSIDDFHSFTSYKDAVGNVYSVGHTNPTGTDPSSSWDNTASEIAIVKTTSEGTLDWIYKYENNFGAVHNIVEIGTALYAGGVIYDGGVNKGYILKISAAGEVQWSKVLGDTSEITDVTTDGTYLYAVGNHTANGASIAKINPGGTIAWTSTIDYTTGSPNTLFATSCVFTGDPTTSVDSYENEGDATADRNLYIALRDNTNNESIIARFNQNGGFITAYSYGDIYINKLRLDTGNGDGIYFAMAGYYDNSGVETPLLARISITGEIEWQHQSTEGTANGRYLDVLPIGTDLYVVGYIEDATSSYTRGLQQKFTSNGTWVWSNTITSGTDDTWLTGINLDGVNVIASGNRLGNAFTLNTQRDTIYGIGTVTNNNWIYTLPQNVVNTQNTVLTKSVFAPDVNALSLSLTDQSLSLQQTSGLSRVIDATRDGFAGIGTGINFTINGLVRKPKEGSVVHIEGDDETYFCIEVANYFEAQGDILGTDNNPNAYEALTENRTWIQEETIGWINDQIANAGAGDLDWLGFTYDQNTCSRDVGLIIDALAKDLDSSELGVFEQNDLTIDAALSYWSGSVSEVAGQETQTIAAITYMKGLVANALNKTSPAQTYSIQTQYTSHSTVEAGTQTFLEDRIDIIIDVIDNGPSAAPLQVGSGSATISLDPPIPSNKTPNDNTPIVFREAFSQVRMTGHDFLDIGTGGFADTNYPVIIQEDYPQQPDQNREVDVSNGGRVFYVTTDQDGNFRVGDYFKVEQATGRATLSSEEFDLSGLNELQLGSIKAGKQGATVNEFSTDGTFADNSDTSVPTERATKTYVDTQIGLATATQSQIVAGIDPTKSKVEVSGSGLSTDAVNIAIGGTTVASVDIDTFSVKPAGTTSFEVADQYMLVPKGGTADRPSPSVSGYTRFNTDIGALEVYNGTAWVPAGGLANVDVTTTYTASAFQNLFVDTTSTTITVTLPQTPNKGDEIRLMDAGLNFATNNLTISRNGKPIMGDSEDLVVDTDGAAFALVFINNTVGWIFKDR
jgi:hypothetical protein